MTGTDVAEAMKQVLGIRDEKTRMKVTPPLVVAPIAQEDVIRTTKTTRTTRTNSYSCTQTVH